MRLDIVLEILLVFVLLICVNLIKYVKIYEDIFYII